MSLDNSLIKVLWYVPPVVFAARVNMPTGVSYPIQDIVFDGVTTGAYTDCVADQFFTLGSGPGLDDYGRGRLRAAPTSNTLKVGRASQGTSDGQLNVVDNAYLTVWEDYRVHSKIATIRNFVEFKDTDIPVADLTDHIPPVANCGPDYARSIDAGTATITVFLDGRNSYAVADGATLVTFAWDLRGGTPLFGATTADDHLYVEYAAGAYFPALTVTDSNGKQHTARCFVLADDPDDSLCVEGMQVLNITRDKQGQTMKLRTLIDLPRANYPDGAKVLAWLDNDPDPENHQNILFSGWHQSDNNSSQSLETHLRRATTLTCVDVAGKLATLPGFHQRLELPDADEVTWGHMPAPNMDKFIHYLAHWHSTAASVADLFLSGAGADYRFVLFDSAGDNLFDQLNRQANRIAHFFGANELGQLAVTVDQMLLDAEDRTSDVQASLIEEWWTELEYDYFPAPRVHTLRGSALLTLDDWIIDDDGNQTLLTAFSIAPGTAPGQGGTEATQGEELARDQTELNSRTGHRFARSNARYGPITVTPTLGFSTNISPARGTWVELNVSAASAAQRGIDFTFARCLASAVSIDYSYSERGTEKRVRVTLEKETVGLPALTEEKDPALPVGETPPPPTTPPDAGLRQGQELVAGIGLDGYVYVTSDFQTPSGSGGPTWSRTNLSIAEVIYSFVVDPFSPGYAPGATSGAINGWLATEGHIYRITDLFGTPAKSAVVTFGTSAVAASYHWRSIQASFGYYFAEGSNPWLLCISYYGSTSGHEGTWATHSLDGGATWSAEVQISAFYNSGAPSRFNPIGVYASPKTPGLAYTAAHSETADDAQTVGFVSTDWGATWSAYAGIDPGLAQAGSIHLPWPSNDAEDVFYYGHFDETLVIDPDLLPQFWENRNIDSAGDVFTYLSTGYKASITNSVSDAAGGSTSGQDLDLLIVPHPRTKRIQLSATYSALRHKTGASSAISMTLGLGNDGHTTRTDDFSYSTPAYDVLLSGSCSVEWTNASSSADWFENITTVPPTALQTVRFTTTTLNNAVGGSNTADSTLAWSVKIEEIEFLDGTIYAPLATRQFRLKRSAAGILTDISPSDGGVLFGVNRFGFAVRAHDNNRQFVLASVIGNDTSDDPADDFHAIHISSDFGDSWSEVIAPIADSGAPAGRPAFEAAFGGDSEQILFIWGPNNTIYYSDDFGATVDSRAGNLGSLGTSGGFAGIAGGSS